MNIWRNVNIDGLYLSECYDDLFLIFDGCGFCDINTLVIAVMID